jgi:hypothetical protein
MERVIEYTLNAKEDIASFKKYGQACIIHQNTQYFDKILFTSQLTLYFKKVNFLKIECFLIYFHTTSLQQVRFDRAQRSAAQRCFTHFLK